MKIQKYFFIIFGLWNFLIVSSDLNWEFVYSPTVANYQSLFETFGEKSCSVCSGRQAVYKGFDSKCFVKNKASYFDAFESEIQAHEQIDSNRLFVQVTFLDEVIGFMSCQVVSEYRVVIEQLVIDPEKYDDGLVKDFLFVLLQLMPKLKEIGIKCPLFHVNLINLFENLGFMIDQQESNIDLFVQFELKIHPKCSICQVLYGPDFWENEDPDAWEQDPDAEDLGIGFFNVDQSRDDVKPLSEDDDGKSYY